MQKMPGGGAALIFKIVTVRAGGPPRWAWAGLYFLPAAPGGEGGGDFRRPEARREPQAARRCNNTRLRPPGSLHGLEVADREARHGERCAARGRRPTPPGSSTAWTRRKRSTSMRGCSTPAPSSALKLGEIHYQRDETAEAKAVVDAALEKSSPGSRAAIYINTVLPARRLEGRVLDAWPVQRAQGLARVTRVPASAGVASTNAQLHRRRHANRGHFAAGSLQRGELPRVGPSSTGSGAGEHVQRRPRRPAPKAHAVFALFFPVGGRRRRARPRDPGSAWRPTPCAPWFSLGAVHVDVARLLGPESESRWCRRRSACRRRGAAFTSAPWARGQLEDRRGPRWPRGGPMRQNEEPRPSRRPPIASCQRPPGGPCPFLSECFELQGSVVRCERRIAGS